MAGEDDHEPARKKARFTFAEDLKILVGAEKVCFPVSKHTLRDRSSFFKAAFDDRWNKPEEQGQITLPEDDADIFDIYLYTVHHNSVDVGSKEVLDGEPDNDDGEVVQLRLAKTWILADKLGDVVAANVLIDQLRKYYLKEATRPSANVVALIGNNAATRSGIRQLVVDYYVSWGESEYTQKLIDNEGVPRAILGEILRQQTALRESRPWITIARIHAEGLYHWPACRYHQHDDAHPKCQ